MSSHTATSYPMLPVDDVLDGLAVDANPDPIMLEDTDILVGEFLSHGKLQEIAGRDDLEKVKSIEMVVDTTEITLGSFGNYLPNLKQLKLSNSVIPSVRDVGTSLPHLRVLWMACCGLHDVDGIGSMISLRELYLAYNDIEDISAISFLDNLQVLDLEGNKISEPEQFDYLSLLSHLRTLSVVGNPVCNIINKAALQEVQNGENESDSGWTSHREVILKKVPQLRYLDDEVCERGATGSSHSSSDRQVSVASSSHSQEDIDLITNAIKEGLISEEEATMQLPGEPASAGSPATPTGARPGSASLRRPVSAMGRFPMGNPVGRPIRSPLTRPQTALPGGRSTSAGTSRTEELLQRAMSAQRPVSTGSGDVALQDDTSTLTFGDVICGNPLKALRARKASPNPVLSFLTQEEMQKPQTFRARPATAAGFRRAAPGGSLPDSQERSDLYLELKEWRKSHEERMAALFRDDVQVLKLDHPSDDDSEISSSSANGTDSDADEMLDLDASPCTQDSNNNNFSRGSKGDDGDSTSSDQVSPSLPVHSPGTSRSSQVRSPPPKNLSPSSMSSLSPRNSPVSPRSPLFSSSQLESTSIPVLRGSPRRPTPPSLKGKVVVKHLPAPPKVGAPRPRTAADFRLRRSLGSSDAFVPLASPMTLPQANSPNKRQTSGRVKP